MSVWIRFGWMCAVNDTHVHAVKARHPKIKRKPYDAACGAHVQLFGFPVKDHPGDFMTAPWPPYVADAREWGYERCRACMTEAPGKPARLLLEDIP